MSDLHTIGKAANAAGRKVETIRYYEQIGLLAPPWRSEGNQRPYDERAVQRLKFIRHSRELGFPLQAVRDLLNLSDHPIRPCDAADVFAKERLEDVELRIGRLQALRLELNRMISQCKGDRIADCRVIEVLGDHNHSETADHSLPSTDCA